MSPRLQTSRSRTLGLFFLFLAVASICMAADERKEGLTALREADQSFHRTLQTLDRNVFRAYVSENAVFLNDEVYRGRTEFILGWRRVFEAQYLSYESELIGAHLAGSGELGWTLGQATLTVVEPGREKKQREVSGHHFVVWALESGRWKILAHCAVVIHAEHGAGRDARSALLASWPELEEFSDGQIRLDWKPEITTRAESDDLLFTFGEYQVEMSKAEQQHSGAGAFVSIWQRDAAGRWHLEAEGLTPPKIH